MARLFRHSFGVLEADQKMSIAKSHHHSTPITLGAPLIAICAILILARPVFAQAPPRGVAGTWTGTSTARCGTFVTAHGRCNAAQDIILKLKQEASKVTGSYGCSYGNQNCRNMNESGKIADGSFTGDRLSMRVMMKDGSSCRFTGQLRDSNLGGVYSCKGGGERLERGSWETKRLKFNID